MWILDGELIDVEFETECFRERVARQVVFGGTEAAGDDEDVGVIERDVDLVGNVIEHIADHALADERRAVRFERAGDFE